MKAELNGATYHVALDESDVQTFAERWPCYGERRPLCFTFSRENGDLVDITGDESGTAADGIAALSNDASLAGALVLGLEQVATLREPFSGIAGDPMTREEALEYAPQWGSYMTAGDPGAVFYGVDINPPEMALAYLGTLYSKASELADVLALRRLALWLESEFPFRVLHDRLSGTALIERKADGFTLPRFTGEEAEELRTCDLGRLRDIADEFSEEDWSL